MSDQTWRETRFAAVDHEAIIEALGTSDQTRHDQDPGPDIHFNNETSPEPADYRPLWDAGIPFTGSHGSYPGSYPAFAFAFDGERFVEVMATEDGWPVVGVDKDGPSPTELAEVAEYWAVYERAIAKIAERDSGNRPHTGRGTGLKQKE